MTRDLLQRHRALRVLVGLAIVALTIHVAQLLWAALVVAGDVVLMFLLAWIITFILAPVSARLQRIGMHRVAAVSLVYFALLVVTAGMIVVAIPAVKAEVSLFAARLTALTATNGTEGLSSTVARLLQGVGFSPADAHRLGDELGAKIPEFAASLSNSAVGSATQLLSSIATVVLNASLIVILSFYMMLEGDTLVEEVVTKLPPKWIPDVRLFQSFVDDIFAGFFRAQLIIAGIYAVCTWIILAIFGLGGAWLVALISGVLIILPLIGVFLSVIPPALAVVLGTPSTLLLPKVILLVFLLGAAQHLVLNLIAPRVFGQHMGVPTLILFGALLLGAAEGGVWGAFFAGPVVAVAYAMLEVHYGRFSAASPLYKRDEDEDEDEDEGEGVGVDLRAVSQAGGTSNGARDYGDNGAAPRKSREPERGAAGKPGQRTPPPAHRDSLADGDGERPEG